MKGQIINRGKNVWYVRIFLGRDANGKRKDFNQTIHGTKKDAQKFLTAKLREIDLGIFTEPSLIPLNEYIDKWLEEVAKPRVRENTFDSYSLIVKNYIKKHLGNLKLSDIQPYQVQKFYNQLQKQGLSSRTVRYAHTVLSSALKQAVKWKIIIQNPCELCDLPKLVKKEKQVLTPAQARIFWEEAKQSKCFALLLLVIESGLRPSEYLGLQWKDLDFEKKVLSVRRTVIERVKGGYYFGETKTAKSRRSMPLSDTVINSLKTHRRNQLEERLKLGSEYQNLDLIFASEVGTPLQRRNVIRRHFKPLLKKANLPDITLYELRHTTATLLLSEGENPKIVSERLGHSSVVLTLDTYSHVLPTMQEEATAKLERIFKKR
jgi:integrase